MLFDRCRAQADTAAGDVVPMALSTLGKGKDKGKGKKGESNKDEKDKDRDKKGKGKTNTKATEYFAGYRLLCKAWGQMKKDFWWYESAKSGKDTAFPETHSHAATNTATEPPITGMLIQSDEGEARASRPHTVACTR